MSDGTKFTPGPWGVGSDRKGHVVFGPATATGPFRQEAPWLAEVHGNVTPGESAANAHLISAAPDLYAALVVALERHFCSECRESHAEGKECQAKVMFLAALAKARGEPTPSDPRIAEGGHKR